MFCSNCGKAMQPDWNFCSHCGIKVEVAAEATEDRAQASGASSDTPSSEPTSTSPGQPWFIFVAAGVLLFMVLAAIFSSGPKSGADMNSANLSLGAADSGTSAIENAGNATTTAIAQENWSYSTDEDKVRGATTFYAETTSTNSVSQDPPYDSDTKMRLVIRKSPGSGTDVMFIISSGQMMCSSYDGCSGTVRFDDSLAQRVNFNGPSDNSSETVFVVGAKSFISKLKRAKKVVIEKTLYEAGSPQFEFDVAGLKWDH